MQFSIEDWFKHKDAAHIKIIPAYTGPPSTKKSANK